MNERYNYNLGLQFYDVAQQYANNYALKYPGGKHFTYAELDKRSNRFANYLLQNNVEKGDVVAILNNKSFEAYSLMLACIKTGTIYCNLDFTSPWVRIAKVLGTCQPKIVFNDHESENLVSEIRSELGINVVHIYTESFKASIDELSDAAPSAATKNITGADAAYIMFTSGSTGFPKGAVMSHSNVLNFISWGQTTFSVTENDVFTNANPIYFDNSVFDFYTSLFSGACLVPFSADIVKDSRTLVKAVNESGCTIWFSVPSLLVYLLTTRALSAADFPSMKRISFGGEGFPKPKLKQLYDLFGSRITLFNVYGPTECTCICSSYVISERDFTNMNELAPLGHMAPNFGFEILPLDESNPNYGELGLTGPKVGLGYYNDPERTAKSFVQNPNARYFQRMYRTGDLVEKKDDGYIYFRGRVDNQVKHMGYRIELEEIEAAINTLSYVNESCVVYKKVTPELGQIVAFVTLNASKDSGQILDELRTMLPPYMIPKKMNVVEALPKNRNGKTDRTQLAALLE